MPADPYNPWRTDNGGLSRVPRRSRHTYNLRGRQLVKAQGGSRWQYFRSNTFWYILGGVAVVFAGLFFLVKDVTVYEGAQYVWREILKPNFFVSETAPVYDEEGHLVQSGEIRYTVPAKLAEAPKPPQ